MSSGYVLREVDGDLFTSPDEFALAHCVSVDLRMGAGIAVQFRNRFKQIDNLKKQNVQTGGVAVIKHDSRFVYYLITKDKAYQKPTYKDLSLSLHAMREHMLKNNIRKLAIPKIGCGLDGLQWEKVKDLLDETFSEDDLEIVVYNFVP